MVRKLHVLSSIKVNEMKKLLAITSIFFFACNNSADSTKSADPGTSGGTENVNGNIPDTNSGLILNQPLPIDSSHLRDSANR